MLLARTLHMPLAEAKDRIDSAELATWIAEYELAPWGEARADLQSANVARMVFATQTGKDLPQAAFLPQLAPPAGQGEQTQEQMRDTLAGMAAMGPGNGGT